MIEVEVKVAIDEKEKEEIIKKLNSHGEPLGAYSEEDLFFRNVHDASYGKNKTLKLRRRNDEIKLIFKCKGANEEFKENLEIEVKIDEHDANNVLQLLKYLGFEESTTIKKKRIAYRVDDCFVNLDDVENLGLFVEIEVLTDEHKRGEAHEKIRKVLSILGISGKKLIRCSYVEMLKKEK
ncbi:MAG: class IV adenylate cyclase [Candidatus Nezhaarchaeales archaeon]